MRPQYIIFIFCLCLSPQSYSADSAGKNDPFILVVGDSLSAGFGIDQSKNWVNLLAGRLKERDIPFGIYNASISGETSLGGLNRLPGLLVNRPQLVIIELGANDGLRGLPLARLRTNLEEMIQRCKSTGAEVLLVGMKIPPNYGPAYTNGFYNIYQELAKKHDIPLVPFLLDGIATQRKLMQEDNMHPTAEAQPLILENVWIHLNPLITNMVRRLPGDQH